MDSEHSYGKAESLFEASPNWTVSSIGAKTYGNGPSAKFGTIEHTLLGGAANAAIYPHPSTQPRRV